MIQTAADQTADRSDATRAEPDSSERPDPRGTGDLAVYVNCFGPARTLNEPPFVPIHVGAALAKVDHGTVRDDMAWRATTRASTSPGATRASAR